MSRHLTIGAYLFIAGLVLTLSPWAQAGADFRPDPNYNQQHAIDYSPSVTAPTAAPAQHAFNHTSHMINHDDLWNTPASQNTIARLDLSESAESSPMSKPADWSILDIEADALPKLQDRIFDPELSLGDTQSRPADEPMANEVRVINTGLATLALINR